VTEAGNSMLDNDSQPQNAYPPIEVRDEGNSMLFNEAQPKNA
jgi:hypothetical protein